jgi:hypothetical protein
VSSKRAVISRIRKAVKTKLTAEAEFLNTPKVKNLHHPLDEQTPEDSRSNPSPAKKQFVEPVVSVPTEVLEATTFFQAPTIESATT